MNAPTRELKAKVWERDPLDYYVEPRGVSEALFRVEGFIGDIWDPACGGGHIVQAALQSYFGRYVVGTDIKRRTVAPWFHSERDFLEQSAKLAPNIATNPPYFSGRGTEGFIRKALMLATGKVAIFTDVRFLSGAKRAAGLFTEHPPTRVWLLAPRPSCPPGVWLDAGNKAGGGTADYCWIVWTLTAPRPAFTEIRWLNWSAK